MATARTSPRRRSALFDLMVAVSIAISSVGPILGTPRLGSLALIGMGMAAALLLRRRYPLAVMAAVSTLALLQVVFFPPSADPMPFDAAVLIAMYSVVKYGRPLWHGYVAAVPVAIGVVIEVARHVDPTRTAVAPLRLWSEAIGFLAVICAAVWLTGFTVRTRHLYMLGLEERAATAERERDHLAKLAVVEERASIARDLHDVVAHSMAVMIVQADGASYALDSDPESARVAIKQVASTGRDALEDMRRLVDVLRGTTPDRTTDPADSATDRRRIGLDQVGALADRARSAGLTLTVHEEGSRAHVPAAVELTIYRVLQEALTNVLRHAGTAATVTADLRYGPDTVALDVVDDGGGALTAGLSTPDAGGHGLVGMRERVGVHGGAFDAGPRLGGGWRVAVEIPWT